MHIELVFPADEAARLALEAPDAGEDAQYPKRHTPSRGREPMMQVVAERRHMRAPWIALRRSGMSRLYPTTISDRETSVTSKLMSPGYSFERGVGVRGSWLTATRHKSPA